MMGEFPGSLVFRIQRFPAVAGVQHLVRDLRSRKPCGAAKN